MEEFSERKQEWVWGNEEPQVEPELLLPGGHLLWGWVEKFIERKQTWFEAMTSPRPDKVELLLPGGARGHQVVVAIILKWALGQMNQHSCPEDRGAQRGFLVALELLRLLAA